MKLIICVFVEQLAHPPQLVHRLKLVMLLPTCACVVPQLHVPEVLQLQPVTRQIMYANVATLPHVLEARRHQLVTNLIIFANVELLQIALQIQQHLHAMNQIIGAFVEL